MREEATRDRRTKADLLQVIEGLEGELEGQRRATHFAEERESRAAKHIEEFDLEARAISACVKALKGLPSGRSSLSAPVYDRSSSPQAGPVGRVLSHLASRFDLPDPYAEIAHLRAELEDAQRAQDELRDLREQLREMS